MERLRALLPSLQAALLKERARLEQQRERVQSAAEWARNLQPNIVEALAESLGRLLDRGKKVGLPR